LAAQHTPKLDNLWDQNVILTRKGFVYFVQVPERN
jgi:hypothetical protein